MARWQSNQTLTEYRQKCVAEARVRGHTMGEIAELLARPTDEGGYGIVNPLTDKPYTVATVSDDIHKLEAFWLEQARQDVVAHRAKILLELQALKVAGWAMGGYPGFKVVLAAIQRECQLCGLDAPAKVQNYNVDIPWGELDDTELAALSVGANPYDILARHSHHKGEELLRDVDLSGLDSPGDQDQDAGQDAEAE